MSDIPRQAYRASISRILVSQQSLAALARCRPFCNIEFRRYACQSPAAYYRSRRCGLFREPTCSPSANSRLPRPRECESVQKVRRSVYASGKCGVRRERDLNFKCECTRVDAHRNGLDFLSAKLPFDGNPTVSEKISGPMKILSLALSC